MTERARIERGLWWDRAWSICEGCTPVSEACRNCWSAAQTHTRAQQRGEKMRARYGGLTNKAGRFNGKVRPQYDSLYNPLRVRKPTTWALWNDIWHKDVPDEFIDRALAVMASAGRQTFIVLTKRPQRMRAYFERIANGAPEAASAYETRMREHFNKYKQEFREGYSLPEPPTPELRFIYDSATTSENGLVAPDGTTIHGGFGGGEYHWRPWPLSNVILGTTVENQKAHDERVPHLLATPAARRVISYEPALEAVDFRPALSGYPEQTGRDDWTQTHPPPDWIIAGCESGRNARESQDDWFRQVRDQCQAAGVPFFLKQQVGQDCKLHKMPELDGKRWAEMPW